MGTAGSPDNLSPPEFQSRVHPGASDHVYFKRSVSVAATLILDEQYFDCIADGARDARRSICADALLHDE